MQLNERIVKGPNSFAKNYISLLMPSESLTFVDLWNNYNKCHTVMLLNGPLPIYKENKVKTVLNCYGKNLTLTLSNSRI